MASSSARTVDRYLSELPPDRREALTALRRLILENLPRGYEEEMQFGMIGYQVPLSRYPKTYNGKPLSYVALASQKQYMALYLMTVYGDAAKERWFSEAFRKAGKKLDMGKSCVRFSSLDALPLSVIAEVVAGTSVDAFIARYEATRSAATKPASRAKPAPQARPFQARSSKARPSKAPSSDARSASRAGSSRGKKSTKKAKAAKNAKVRL